MTQEMTQEELNLLPFTDAERLALLGSQSQMQSLMAQQELIVAKAAHLRDVLPLAQQTHQKLLDETIAAAKKRQATDKKTDAEAPAENRSARRAKR